MVLSKMFITREEKGHSPSDINTKSKALDLHQQCHECLRIACADRYPLADFRFELLPSTTERATMKIKLQIISECLGIFLIHYLHIIHSPKERNEVCTCHNIIGRKKKFR